MTALLKQPVSLSFPLPIDTVGSLSFPHGVQIRFSATFNVVQNDTLSLSGGASLSNGSASSTLTFSGSGAPTGEVQMNFDLLSSAGSLSIISSNAGPSPFTTTGDITGPGTQYQTAIVNYDYHD